MLSSCQQFASSSSFPRKCTTLERRSESKLTMKNLNVIFVNEETRTIKESVLIELQKDKRSSRSFKITMRYYFIVLISVLLTDY